MIDLVQNVQMNLKDNPYLEPPKKSDDEIELEEKLLRRREYENRVKSLEELIGQLYQQEENDSQR